MISQAVTEGFADPDDLARRVGTAGAQPSAGQAPCSLSYGLPGIALLFAELGRADERYERLAGGCLALAAGNAAPPAWNGLHNGYPALAYACRAVRRGLMVYAGVLERLDQAIAELTANTLARHHRALAEPGTLSCCDYDVITGLTGLGRYLLLPGADHSGTLADVLHALVLLARPLRVEGTEVPGWWATHPSSRARCDLGVAHGMSGSGAVVARVRARCVGARPAGGLRLHRQRP
ncbi:lanthionine synthetase LanC family protein [Nonomuraea candida]|uniref:lanthionine synthetase LanC family protein n=1 Tax=Nonomuraea candida TaxID=359159 RepID=UPI000B0A4C20